MDDQEPPKPPFLDFAGSQRHCRCGQPVTSRAIHCPRCGALLPGSPDETLNALGVGCLGLLALLSGGFGTCSLVIGLPALLGAVGASALPTLMFGAGASFLAILCARRIAEAIRARRSKL